MSLNEVDKSSSKEITLVTFILEDVSFGIDVLRAREVMYLDRYTAVPNTLDYMKGLLDLRGEIIPLVDGRMKFGLQENRYNEDTVVVIIEYSTQVVGIIVDAVSDVINISDDELEERMNFTDDYDHDYVQGVVRSDDKLVLVLDADKVFNEKELTSLGEEKIESDLESEEKNNV